MDMNDQFLYIDSLIPSPPFPGNKNIRNLKASVVKTDNETRGRDD